MTINFRNASDTKKGLLFTDAHMLQRLTSALDLMTTSLVISARSMVLQRWQPLVAKPPEMKVGVQQAEDPASVQSLKNLKCCVRYLIRCRKMTCFPWVLPAVDQAEGQALVLRDCLFSKVQCSPKPFLWKWRPLLKTKCLRQVQCPRYLSLGAQTM